MSEHIGKYELDRLVATGGMAEIWTATAPDGREVAIKRILPHLARDERFTRMFLDEAAIASRLNHPHIAQIFELGQDEDEYFIAMEYIDGMDVADILDALERARHFMPIELAIRLTIDVLRALNFAHEFALDGRPLHIVHRDVSPHNVLVSKTGSVKLVDFGVAKAVERNSKTQTGLVKGKLSYMAPEQIEEKAVDCRADVFAAGVLLFECLTNEAPFGRELYAISAILNDAPPDPRTIRKSVPGELVEVIERALEKDPERRYASAGEMADALEAVESRFGYRPNIEDVAAFIDALSRGVVEGGRADDERTIPDAEPAAFGWDADGEEAHEESPRAASTRDDHSTNVVLGPVFALLVVAAILASIAFMRGGDGSASRENALPPDAMIFESDEAEYGLDEGAEDAVVFELEGDDDLRWQLWGEYSGEDLLVEEWLERAGLEEAAEERWDPGDPAVLAVLELPQQKRVERKRPKRKRTVKARRKSNPAPDRPASPKKSKVDLKRIDKVIPNF